MQSFFLTTITVCLTYDIQSTTLTFTKETIIKCKIVHTYLMHYAGFECICRVPDTADCSNDSST